MAETKDTNPKDAVGVQKWRQYSTVPQTVIWELGVAMLEGARKYGRHNYRIAGVRASVYVDAAKGHIDQWWEGEDIDFESGLSHITKSIASLAVLRDAMINDMLNDDRPPKANIDRVREEMQAAVDLIFERFPDPVEPYLEGAPPRHKKMTPDEKILAGIVAGKSRSIGEPDVQRRYGLGARPIETPVVPVPSEPEKRPQVSFNGFLVDHRKTGWTAEEICALSMLDYDAYSSFGFRITRTRENQNGTHSFIVGTLRDEGPTCFIIGDEVIIWGQTDRGVLRDNPFPDHQQEIEKSRLGDLPPVVLKPCPHGYSEPMDCFECFPNEEKPLCPKCSYRLVAGVCPRVGCQYAFENNEDVPGSGIDEAAKCSALALPPITPWPGPTPNKGAAEEPEVLTSCAAHGYVGCQICEDLEAGEIQGAPV